MRAVADAIADLAREPERRLALSREARHRAWEISWHHSEKALLHAYAAALGRAEDPQWPESRSAGDRNEREWHAGAIAGAYQPFRLANVAFVRPFRALVVRIAGGL
ncbi:MAG: hypothetical protein JOZ73_09475 [Solirubrobacterales bacterium]|nr:hypothetical protein [Solirubrobacterales bacterium]